MSTKYIPKIGDKFEFHVRGHFRPVVIEIIKVSLDETVQKNPKTYCIGEELDGKETVRDCFNYDKFTVSW